MERRGAAAVIIGNEVLSAKVTEQNGAKVIERLRERGLELRELCIVPDEVDAIVEAVSRVRRKALWVISSGGIGPTHDDVTVRAVALALGREVVRHRALEALVHQHYPPPITEESLRLADVPEGAQLLSGEGLWFPVIACEGVFLLPGVPQLFTLQLETVLATLPRAEIFLRTLYLRGPEGGFAAVLDRVASAHPAVGIGSYPTFDRTLDYTVKVTIEHSEDGPVDRVMEELLRCFAKDSVVRVDR